MVKVLSCQVVVDSRRKSRVRKTLVVLASIKRCFPDSDHNKDIVTLLKKYIRRTELMNQTLETALVIKKGSTQKGDKPLMASAHKDTIHRIAAFF